MTKPTLHWPLSTPTVITQPFGVNGEYYRANGIDILFHNGLDLLAYHGQPVFASHTGLASYQIDDRGGHGITIRSEEKALLFGQETYYKTGYWHLCDFRKEKQYKPLIPTDGEEYPVKVGDIIGYADSTGFSSGDHVHFFLKPIAQDKKGRWYNIRQDNGVGGCVDPSFYMSKFSAPEYVKSLQRANDAIETVEKALVHYQDVPEAGRRSFLDSLMSVLVSLGKLFK